MFTQHWALLWYWTGKITLSTNGQCIYRRFIVFVSCFRYCESLCGTSDRKTYPRREERATLETTGTILYSRYYTVWYHIQFSVNHPHIICVWEVWGKCKKCHTVRCTRAPGCINLRKWNVLHYPEGNFAISAKSSQLLFCTSRCYN